MKKIYGRDVWMSVLSKAPLPELERHWAAIPHPAFQWARWPECGAVMLRGRVGKTGMTFNLGEATVTRCTLQIETGEVGVAYVLGRSKRHAALAALFDGLMQQEQTFGRDAISSIITSLEHHADEQNHEIVRNTYKSKVDFFMYETEGVAR